MTSPSGKRRKLSLFHNSSTMSGSLISGSSAQSGSNRSGSTFRFSSAFPSSATFSSTYGSVRPTLFGGSSSSSLPSFGVASSKLTTPPTFRFGTTKSPKSKLGVVGSSTFSSSSIFCSSSRSDSTLFPFGLGNSGSQPVQQEVPVITVHESGKTDAEVSLRILIDKGENRVLYAEAGKDFVDVLLSFFTLPLGTIARLVCKESNVKPVKIGSLSALYGSVENLDVKHFWAETCKDMLLQPRNSMEAYCRHLKLNIDNTNPTKYFICQKWNCSRRESGGLLSTFKNKRCSCGNMMNKVIPLSSSLNSGQINEGYVHETVAFIISDDLMIMPDNLQTSVLLLRDLGIVDMDVIGEMIVNVSQQEVLDLLKSSLLSKTPLTDVFLGNKQFLEHDELEGQFPHEISNVPDIESRRMNVKVRHMNVKVMLQKSNGKILFVQAEEDFVDFLFSFLTFPLGSVEHMLEGTLCAGTLDKLYKSVVDLPASRHFRSEEVKNMLIDPRIAQQFKLYNQILPIKEACPSKYSCYSFLQGLSGLRGYLTPAREYSCRPKANEVYAPLTLIDPKSSKAETSSPVGFVKGPAMYMVTDDLVVTPISSISATTFLSTLKIPLTDLEEREVSIGVKEGLSILKASLVSSSALTAGLGPFIKTT